MPKTKISEYSATANSNTDVASINIDEGCAPSGINNAIRAIMGHLKDFQSGTSNDPFTIGSSGSLTLSYGTANGVAYLNGSKAVTSGSALTFDGTNFATTGTASATKIIPTGGSATGNGMYLPASNTLAWSNNGSETMRLDSAGNLGLGVTPSAWGTSFKVLQFANAASIGSSNDPTLQITQNGFYNGTNWIYSTTAPVSNYYQSAGTHVWRNAPSGTAGNTISFTQAMTLDASGNLGVGTTSPATKFNVADSSNNCTITVTNSSSNFQIQSNTNDGYFNLNGSGNIIFRSGTPSVTERARIDSSGYFKASNNGTYTYTGTMHEFKQTTTSTEVITLTNSSASPFGQQIYHVTDINNATNFFLYCYAGSTQRIQLRTNGGIGNFSANDINLSDRREKTNFAPAGSYLDKICAIPVQTFNYIDQNLEEDAGLTLGVVAQDVQVVAPELVMESNWGTEESPKQRLSIYQTDLQYALMKSIQEMKAIIDSQAERIAALEAK